MLGQLRNIVEVAEFGVVCMHRNQLVVLLPLIQHAHHCTRMRQSTSHSVKSMSRRSSCLWRPDGVHESLRSAAFLFTHCTWPDADPKAGRTAAAEEYLIACTYIAKAKAYAGGPPGMTFPGTWQEQHTSNWLHAHEGHRHDWLLQQHACCCVASSARLSQACSCRPKKYAQ